MVFSNSQEAAIIVGAVIDNHINALARARRTCVFQQDSERLDDQPPCGGVSGFSISISHPSGAAADYFRVDRRLGSNEALGEFSRNLHRRGLRLVLDAVFHQRTRFVGVPGCAEEWPTTAHSRRSLANSI